MLHRLCGPPSIPLSFNLATVLPRRGTYCVSCDTKKTSFPTSSTHRLGRGLPGYLILFATHAFRPVIPINACTLCITAAAGTELAGASSLGTIRDGDISSALFVPTESALQPEGLLHTRGIAGSGLPPLSNIPHCCLP